MSINRHSGSTVKFLHSLPNIHSDRGRGEPRFIVCGTSSHQPPVSDGPVIVDIAAFMPSFCLTNLRRICWIARLAFMNTVVSPPPHHVTAPTLIAKGVMKLRDWDSWDISRMVWENYHALYSDSAERAPHSSWTRLLQPSKCHGNK